MATLGLGEGGAKDLKPENLGRKPLLEGGSCSSTMSVCGSPTRDSKRERNTSQLPRLLCWTIEVRRKGACPKVEFFLTRLFMAGTSPCVQGGYWLDGPPCGCRGFTIGRGRRAASWLAGGGEVHCVTGGCVGLGSRGCILAICRHIHGVFTLEGAWGPSRGE